MTSYVDCAIPSEKRKDVSGNPNAKGQALSLPIAEIQEGVEYVIGARMLTEECQRQEDAEESKYVDDKN